MPGHPHTVWLCLEQKPGSHTRTDGQMGLCVWPGLALARAGVEGTCAGVCKWFKPKGALLSSVGPDYQRTHSSPSLHKPTAPVLVLTRISSCKEVTIATTRSIGREERGLLRQSGRLVAGR